MKKCLLKGLLIFSFLFITFFCIEINVKAASFAYADFNWDEFLKQHKNYWVSGCDEEDEDCVDRVLKTKKNFYTRLYSLLAEYERKGFKIDDNIIIETVFFGLTPDSFADTGTFEDEYEGQVHKYGYTIDESENRDKYIASDDGNKELAKDYFKREEDSLKTLMNNMIGYTRECYGVSNELPYTVQNQDGSYSTVCNGVFSPINNKCMVKVNTIKTNYYDSIGLSFLFSDNSSTKCQELTKDYYSYELGPVSSQEVNEEIYWDFLINNVYFDNKFQLQSYFKMILDATGHKNMNELSEAEYEKYNKEIVATRTKIVNNIKNVLETYGEFAETPSSTGREANITKYWWPIGGAEITETDGIKMAIGEPVSTNITSNFGTRNDPLNGEVSGHHGVDISGIEGTTPVIAALNGVVVTSALGETGSCVVGDTECGGKYGNYVVIQHTDGNYTLYAHMATNSVLVKEGDTVKQGQVLGYVGNTGKSTGPHLHFEVRVGGNDLNSAQQPLNFISATDARAAAASGTMADWIAILEGGSKSGNNYVVEDIGDGEKTFGPGITVSNNSDIIKAHGIDPNSLTVGSLIPINTGNAIFSDVLNKHVDSVKQTLSSAGITVNDEQLTALVSLHYNNNLNGFVNAYNSYGTTNSLCTDWWHNKALHDGNGKYYPGLAKRRIAECDLFVNGVYNMNPYE